MNNACRRQVPKPSWPTSNPSGRFSMDIYPPPDTKVQTIGFSEFCEVEGQTFKRRKGTQKWAQLDPDDNPGHHDHPLQLSLVHHNQAPGEPIHWALYVARENDPGMVYEVNGDAECMAYTPSSDPVQILDSDTFQDIFLLANLTDGQAAVVRQLAEQEPPPRAASRKEVKENCQGWAVRVLARLAERGIVDTVKVDMARSMVQPI
ncbi:predicted protein [Uncinocarpus reesii 1704]|uniref:Uncharacterized protein n=1 Tax=Uncinocarpus reesii (strain UAMH 1704) TaxID=336963 RepID=C4JY34_UNCRE|nr:uncharacterized protein UREG_07085 [Uncinocarpus reesii 1704]EEP82220.1 predicted protein [Uncinocarpus reesii 1704]